MTAGHTIVNCVVTHAVSPKILALSELFILAGYMLAVADQRLDSIPSRQQYQWSRIVFSLEKVEPGAKIRENNRTITTITTPCVDRTRAQPSLLTCRS